MVSTRHGPVGETDSKPALPQSGCLRPVKAQSKALESEAVKGSGDTWTRLFEADALAPGTMVGVEVGELKLAVCNVGGTFYATQNVCPHAFAILSDGWLDDDVLECPLHGGRFDVTTGQALRGPAEGSLLTYAVRIAGGYVEVLLPAGV